MVYFIHNHNATPVLVCLSMMCIVLANQCISFGLNIIYEIVESKYIIVKPRNSEVAACWFINSRTGMYAIDFSLSQKVTTFQLYLHQTCLSWHPQYITHNILYHSSVPGLIMPATVCVPWGTMSVWTYVAWLAFFTWQNVDALSSCSLPALICTWAFSHVLL